MNERRFITNWYRAPMQAARRKQLFLMAMRSVERGIAQCEGARIGRVVAPLEHIFGDGIYIRKITMPKGMLVTSKLHKTTHPYFVMRGVVDVLTDKGTVRIVGPHHGITQAGTKRLLYVHEETVWITVHATNETDIDKIEAELTDETDEFILEHTQRSIA